MSKKYLYRYAGYSSNELYRYLVSRETESNIWIKTQSDNEIQISKKTYSTGSGWDRTRYYEKTPEILEKYHSHQLKRLFLEKLDDLKKCEDEDIMKKVIAINPEDF